MGREGDTDRWDLQRIGTGVSRLGGGEGRDGGQGILTAVGGCGRGRERDCRLGENIWTEVGQRVGKRALADRDMVILQTKRLAVWRRTLEILGEGSRLRAVRASPLHIKGRKK